MAPFWNNTSIKFINNGVVENFYTNKICSNIFLIIILFLNGASFLQILSFSVHHIWNHHVIIDMYYVFVWLFTKSFGFYWNKYSLYFKLVSFSKIVSFKMLTYSKIFVNVLHKMLITLKYLSNLKTCLHVSSQWHL